MQTCRERMERIILQKAEEAWGRPLLASGLWHHGDIRDNVYDAAYIQAAALNEKLPVSFPREQALSLARSVWLQVLSLQDDQPESPTYGHWPLSLGDHPQEAEKNTLPAELMSSLLVYWSMRYGAEMDDALGEAFRQTLEHLYHSDFYRQPLRLYNHHEVKYIAAKLLFGSLFHDSELLLSGRRSLQLLVERIQQKGMAEYAALPWFWHWIQALTCVYDCVPDSDIREGTARLLEELWRYRASHYLHGAWVGGRMRSLPVDLPRDSNVAFDYVQFGDFALPEPLARVEFAGFLHFDISDDLRRAALAGTSGSSSRLSYEIAPANGGAPLHQIIYRTEHAATGGILERAEEFDNEQHRWEITLPLSETEGANRLYLFSPGGGYTEGDPRHESNAGELLLYEHTVLGIYAPEQSKGQVHHIAGVLPIGEWIVQGNAAYGELTHIYAAVFLPTELEVAEKSHYQALSSFGAETGHGYVVEILEKSAAAERGMYSLPDFIAARSKQQPEWHLEPDAGSWGVSYVNMDGAELSLTLDHLGRIRRLQNGLRIGPV